jgi:hypothetical protein
MVDVLVHDPVFAEKGFWVFIEAVDSLGFSTAFSCRLASGKTPEAG